MNYGIVLKRPERYFLELGFAFPFNDMLEDLREILGYVFSRPSAILEVIDDSDSLDGKGRYFHGIRFDCKELDSDDLAVLKEDYDVAVDGKEV